jgi:hypothetical protein
MRKIQDERDARACVKAARRAGLALGAWAQIHGIDGRSLNAWAVNLARRTAVPRRSDGRPGLVELVATPPTLTPTVTGRDGSQIVVRVGGAQIELGDEFRDETLARVVRVLRTC